MEPIAHPPSAGWDLTIRRQGLEDLPIAAAWSAAMAPIHFNREAVLLLGLPGQTLWEAECPAYFQLCDGGGRRLETGDSPISRALGGQRVARTRLQLLRSDGREVEISGQAYPVRSGERLVGAVALFEDLTFSLEEEHRFEHWMGALSHELRGALQALQLAARVSLGGAPGARRSSSRGMEILERNASLVGRLVHDFLDMAKLGTGTLQCTREPILLRPLLEQISGTLEHPPGRHQLELRVAETLTVLADRDRLHQILANLLGNAAKYSTPGRLLLDSQTLPGRVVIRLSDEGPGISEEGQAQLFQRYSRLPSREEGTGIGLWLARELALRMGGDLWVSSQPGGATTFHLALPEVAPPRASAAPNPETMRVN